MPLSKRSRFPGIKENADGTIAFSLTEEEALEVELAMKAFDGLLIHPEAAERIRNGTIAVALSHYAKDLLVRTEFEASRPAIRKEIEKAVAAEWKASSLCPLPVFLYHRASLLKMLGMQDEARRLFASFLKHQSDLKMDDVDTSLSNYEGTDIEEAVLHARGEV